MGGDNDFNVQAMITRLMWTIWTSLSAVRERPLNLITHSLPVCRGLLSQCTRLARTVRQIPRANTLGIWLPVTHAPTCTGTTNPSRTVLNPIIIDLARNGNSGCENEILGCAKWYFWRKFPWKWKNLGNLSFIARAKHGCTGGWLILWSTLNQVMACCLPVSQFTDAVWW